MNTSIKKISTLFVFSLFTFFVNAKVEIKEIRNGGLKISTDYGWVKVYEPVLLEIINSEPMQRLKRLHQYGPCHFIKKSNNVVYAARIQSDYTRFEHSIGVFVLLRLFDRPLVEQIAGLIHDISHTAFSHLADLIFEPKSQDSAYQDDILEEFLNEHEITEILVKHHINLKSVLPKTGNHPALEKSLPDICADRLEYTLQGGLLAGFLSHNDIALIINDLNFHTEKNIWYFSNNIIAKIFGQASIQLTAKYNAAEWNPIVYKYMAEALKYAISNNLISMDDFKYKVTDNTIWGILVKSNHPQIKCPLEILANLDQIVSTPPQSPTRNKGFSIITHKFRAIDPLISVGKNKFKRLTEKDANFRLDFFATKNMCECGNFTKLPSSPKKSIGLLRGC